MATTQEAIDGAICIDCGIPKGLQIPVLIWLYQQITGVSIQSMIDGAVCIDCAIPKGMQIPVLIGLVNTGGTGGGGTGQVVALTGTNSPTSPPDDPTLAAVAYNAVPNLWVWDTASSTWFQIV